MIGLNYNLAKKHLCVSTPTGYGDVKMSLAEADKLSRLVTGYPVGKFG